MDSSQIGQLISQPINSPGVVSSVTSKVTPDASFQNLMNHLMQQVNDPHVDANQAVNDLVMGKTENVHDVVLSMVKADMSFRLFLEMRNKVMEAYQEISRMQV